MKKIKAEKPADSGSAFIDWDSKFKFVSGPVTIRMLKGKPVHRVVPISYSHPADTPLQQSLKEHRASRAKKAGGSKKGKI